MRCMADITSDFTFRVRIGCAYWTSSSTILKLFWKSRGTPAAIWSQTFRLNTSHSEAMQKFTSLAGENKAFNKKASKCLVAALWLFCASVVAWFHAVLARYNAWKQQRSVVRTKSSAEWRSKWWSQVVALFELSTRTAIWCNLDQFGNFMSYGCALWGHSGSALVLLP